MYSKNIIDGFRTIFSTASVADACDQILGKTMFLPFEIKNRINDKKSLARPSPFMKTSPTKNCHRSMRWTPLTNPPAVRSSSLPEIRRWKPLPSGAG